MALGGLLFDLWQLRMRHRSPGSGESPEHVCIHPEGTEHTAGINEKAQRGLVCFQVPALRRPLLLSRETGK